jgi:hypothetical protein
MSNALINRVRYQQLEGTPYRTLQANTEKEGAELIDFLKKRYLEPETLSYFNA